VESFNQKLSEDPLEISSDALSRIQADIDNQQWHSNGAQLL
jgi:hypothetical protein